MSTLHINGHPGAHGDEGMRRRRRVGDFQGSDAGTDGLGMLARLGRASAKP